MSHEVIPTSEPDSLKAGESWQWDYYPDADHLPSDGWNLAYYLRQGATTAITITGTGAVDHFEVRVAGNITEDYPPGLYRLVGKTWLTSGDTFFIHDAHVIVEPDPVKGEPLGSFAEQMVAKIEAELLAMSTASTTNPLRRWKQGDREEENSLADRESLMRQLGHYREEVRQQRTGKTFRSVRGQFAAP